MPQTWQELEQSPDQWASLRHDDPRLDAFASEVERHYGLPEGVLLAVKNAGERTNPGQVSSAGAEGIMQFIPSTRKKYPHDPNDPFQSIDAAGQYLRDTLRQYSGDVWAALADYNGGPAQGKPVLQGQQPPAAETKAYLQRIYKYMNTKYRGRQP